MAKVKPTYILRDIFESFGTPWISRSKHRKPLDVNFSRGSTRLSKRNTPYSKSKTAQQEFFNKRFAMLECMWNNLIPWQKKMIKQFNDQNKVGKSAKSAFFKLGMRFKLNSILEYWNFNPLISIDYDPIENMINIVINMDVQEEEKTLQEVEPDLAEWERVRVNRGV